LAKKLKEKRKINTICQTNYCRKIKYIPTTSLPPQVAVGATVAAEAAVATARTEVMIENFILLSERNGVYLKG
jgi:hypothetical protein